LRMGLPPPAPPVQAVRDATTVSVPPAVKRVPPPASRRLNPIWLIVGIVIVLILVGGVGAAALMMTGVLRGVGERVTPTSTTAPLASPQVSPTAARLIETVPPTAAVAPGEPTQTLIPTLPPTSTPVPTASRTPTAPRVTGTPAFVPPQPIPTVACTGGRVWNGAECVCPPDKPDFLNGECVPKSGGGGGGNEPPPPPR
jgi:hypothetical protein